ncbi:MAG: nucleoside deaminase [Fuerstiella sp.]|nr:nucleoside deaminase [Fuerstiella sp.]
MPIASHTSFMRRSIEVAKTNPRHPFGAVIVDHMSETIVAEGVNQTRRTPTQHGEMDAINNYSASGANNWKDLTLYTTAEPCAMCMSAILWSGVRRVVYGTSIPTLMQLGWKQIEIRATEVVARSHRPDCEVIASVLVGECDALFHMVAKARKGT